MLHSQKLHRSISNFIIVEGFKKKKKKKNHMEPSR